jgi:hypothetical protein
VFLLPEICKTSLGWAIVQQTTVKGTLDEGQDKIYLSSPLVRAITISTITTVLKKTPNS